ncbi:MAG: TRAP transporter substrate-binding protein [Blautia sp.]|nr:TRAP transporter substrate-binding protein [Blautia sp.]MCM1201243.1 TRAP transporter substrate-binding protein [Bacteroides fragilis]
MERKGRRKNRTGIAAALLAVLAAAAVFCLPVRRHEEKIPEYVFTYAENQAEGYPTTLGAEKFAEMVEERTGGRIRILVYAEGIKGAENDIIRQMKFGGIDFARVSLSQLAEYIPKMNVLQLPYLYTDSAHMWRVLDGEIGVSFLSYADEYGLVGLSWYDAGARNFYTSNRPITCLEDMEGMRIRVQESDMMADMVEALGASAVKIGYAEVYSGIERGIVDGAENNWPSYESMNHDEVAKYFTVDEHTRVPEMQICSGKTWEKLSEEDRAVILACAQESALYERKLWQEREDASRQTAILRGAEVIELSAEEKKRFQTAVQGVYEKYCGDDMDIIDQIMEEGGAQKESPQIGKGL